MNGNEVEIVWVTFLILATIGLALAHRGDE